MNDKASKNKQGQDSSAGDDRQSKSSGTIGCILMVAILALVVLGYVFRDRPGKLSYAKWGEVTIHIPPGAPADFQRLQATLLNDVSDLPGLQKENPLISVARLEPAGATFPEGIEVTWPLRKGHDLKAHRNLHIVHFNEDQQEWQWTGVYAQVDAEEKTATGRVYHFSTTGLTGRPAEQQEPVALRRPQTLLIPENLALPGDFRELTPPTIDSWEGGAKAIVPRHTEELTSGFMTALQKVEVDYRGKKQQRLIPTARKLSFAWSDVPVAVHLPFHFNNSGQWTRVTADITFGGLDNPTEGAGQAELGLDLLRDWGVARLEGGPVPEGIKFHARLLVSREFFRDEPKYEAIHLGGDLPVAILPDAFFRDIPRQKADVGPYQHRNDPVLIYFPPDAPSGWYSIWFMLPSSAIWQTAGYNETPWYRKPVRPSTLIPEVLRGSIRATFFEIRSDKSLSMSDFQVVLGYKEKDPHQKIDLALWERLADAEADLVIKRNGWAFDRIVTKKSDHGNWGQAANNWDNYKFTGQWPVFINGKSRVLDGSISVENRAVSFSFTEKIHRQKGVDGRLYHVDDMDDLDHDWMRKNGVKMVQDEFQHTCRMEFPAEIPDRSAAKVLISGELREKGPEFGGAKDMGQLYWEVVTNSPALYVENFYKDIPRLPEQYIFDTSPDSKEYFVEQYGDLVADHWPGNGLQDEYAIGKREGFVSYWCGGLADYADPLAEQGVFMLEPLGFNWWGVAGATYRRLSSITPNYQTGAETIEIKGGPSVHAQVSQDEYMDWYEKIMVPRSTAATAEYNSIMKAALGEGKTLSSLQKRQRILLGALQANPDPEPEQWVVIGGQTKKVHPPPAQHAKLTEQKRQELKAELQETAGIIKSIREAVPELVKAAEDTAQSVLDLIEAQEKLLGDARHYYKELKYWREEWQRMKSLAAPMIYLNTGELALFKAKREELSLGILSPQIRLALAALYDNDQSPVEALFEYRTVARIAWPGSPEYELALRNVARLELKMIEALSIKTGTQINQARDVFVQYMKDQGLSEEDSYGFDASIENLYVTLTAGIARAWDNATMPYLGDPEKTTAFAKEQLSSSIQEYGTYVYMGLQAITSMLKKKVTLEEIAANLSSESLANWLRLRKLNDEPYGPEQYAQLATCVNMALKLPEIYALQQENPELYDLAVKGSKIDFSTGMDTYLELKTSRLAYAFDIFSPKNTAMLLLPFSVGSIGGRMATGFWGLRSARVMRAAEAAGLEIRTGQEIVASWIGWGKAFELVQRVPGAGPHMGKALSKVYNVLEKSYKFRTDGPAEWQVFWAGARVISDLYYLHHMMEYTKQVAGPRVGTFVEALLFTAFDPNVCRNLIHYSKVPPKTVGAVLAKYDAEVNRFATEAAQTEKVLTQLEEALAAESQMRNKLRLDFLNNYEKNLARSPLLQEFVPGSDALIDQQYALFKAIDAFKLPTRGQDARKAAYAARQLMKRVNERVVELRANSKKLKEAEIVPEEAKRLPPETRPTPLPPETQRTPLPPETQPAPMAPETQLSPRNPVETQPSPVIPKEKLKSVVRNPTYIEGPPETVTAKSIIESRVQRLEPEEMDRYLELGVADSEKLPAKIKEYEKRGDMIRLNSRSHDRAAEAWHEYDAALLKLEDLPQAKQLELADDILRIRVKHAYTAELAESLKARAADLAEPMAAIEGMEMQKVLAVVDDAIGQNRLANVGSKQFQSFPIGQQQYRAKRVGHESANPVYEVHVGTEKYSVKVMRHGPDHLYPDKQALELGLEAELIQGDPAIQKIFGFRSPTATARYVPAQGGREEAWVLVSRWVDETRMGSELTYAEINALKDQFAAHKAFSIIIGDHDRKLDNFLVWRNNVLGIDAGVGKPRHQAHFAAEDFADPTRLRRAREGKMYLDVNVNYLKAVPDRNYVLQNRGSTDPLVMKQVKQKEYQLQQYQLEVNLTYQDYLEGIERAEDAFLKAENARLVQERLDDIYGRIYKDPAVAKEYAEQAFQSMEANSKLIRNEVKQINERSGYPVFEPYKPSSTGGVIFMFHHRHARSQPVRGEELPLAA